MQIRVLFQKFDTPWGGANQFLRALDRELNGNGEPAAALPGRRILLVNSHHFGQFLPEIRAGISSGALVIHRLDGPISSTRRTFRGLLTDIQILLFSWLVSDGVVFQSDWSRRQLRKLGFRHRYGDVIHNAPDPGIFFRQELVDEKVNRRIRVVVTSWSTNYFKGFDLLEKIAASVDKEKFEFLFVGNAPRPLENFVHRPPMASEALAEQLRLCDIYLSASENDSCSNSLLEAIHCGLVPVAIDSGGNPELIGVRELIYETVDEAVLILSKDLTTLRSYAREIPIQSLERVATKYAEFGNRIDQSFGKKTRRIRFELFVAVNNLLRAVAKLVRASRK